MMKPRFSMFPAAVCCAALLAAGCGMFAPDETITPSDLTLAELQAKRRQAMDPEGRYAAAHSTLQRQCISTHRFLDDPEESIVTVQFERPDKTNMTTFMDNAPVSSVIVNGSSGWLVTYGRKNDTTVELTPDQLNHIRLLSNLSSPDGNLQEFFEEIEVVRCSCEDGEFYKLICRDRDREPVMIYIDANDYLTRRMCAVLTLNGMEIRYDSRILRYSMFDGVMIPSETSVRQNNIKQTTKLLIFRLNAEFKSQDFLPPAE